MNQQYEEIQQNVKVVSVLYHGAVDLLCCSWPSFIRVVNRLQLPGRGMHTKLLLSSDVLVVSKAENLGESTLGLASWAIIQNISSRIQALHRAACLSNPSSELPGFLDTLGQVMGTLLSVAIIADDLNIDLHP